MAGLEPRAAGGHALRLAKLEGRRWSAPRTVAEGDSFFVNWADFPALVAVTAKHLAVSWPWKRPGGTYAYDVRLAQSFDGGATWSAPLTPHRDGVATEHGFVSLAAEAGKVRAVWLDGRNAASAPKTPEGEAEEGTFDMTLRTALVDAQGGLSDERELDARTCECCQTALVETARGALVAWRDRSADEVRDMHLARRDGDRWSDPYLLHPDGWKIAGCPVNGPALDAIGDRVAVAWFTGVADTPRVFAAMSADGGASFGEPARVDDGAPKGRVDVTLLADGAALVLWLEEGEKEALVRLRRIGRDGAAGEAATIARTSGARASGFPRMARSGGRLVLAWTEAGKPSRIRAAELKLK